MRLYGTTKDTVNLPEMSVRALRYLTAEADNVTMAVHDFARTYLTVKNPEGGRERFLTSSGEHFRPRQQ